MAKITLIRERYFLYILQLPRFLIIYFYRSEMFGIVKSWRTVIPKVPGMIKLKRMETKLIQTLEDGPMRSTPGLWKRLRYMGRTGTKCINMLEQGVARRPDLMLKSISTNK